jgi:hypothetical protein
MKKLLAIILMLGISLPALANDTEIKLICTLTKMETGEVSHESFSIHEGDTWDEATAECKDMQYQKKPNYSCATYVSESVTYTHTFFLRGVEAYKAVVDRADGSLKIWSTNKLDQTGTCKPFEKKF